MAIDDIRIFQKVLTGTELAYTTQNIADLSILKLAIKVIFNGWFHGLPASNWTNEPHGLVYFNIISYFLSKKCQWRIEAALGHIASDDMLNWKNLLINTSGYDIKGKLVGMRIYRRCADRWKTQTYSIPVLITPKPVSIRPRPQQMIWLAGIKTPGINNSKSSCRIEWWLRSVCVQIQR